ncbi:hypothetical protein AOLI_G00123390 [Acnodon oligacanthus]
MTFRLRELKLIHRILKTHYEHPGLLRVGGRTTIAQELAYTFKDVLKDRGPESEQGGRSRLSTQCTGVKVTIQATIQNCQTD